MMVKKCDHFEDLILCLSLYTNGIVFNRTKKTHCIIQVFGDLVIQTKLTFFIVAFEYLFVLAGSES